MTRTTSSGATRLKKAWVLGAITLLTAMLLTLVIAPSNPLSAGSTYSRAPDGYGAWYQFMQQSMQGQGTPLRRWQKPFDRLTTQPPSPEGVAEVNHSKILGITLLRVHSNPLPELLLPEEAAWVERGNRLVLVGIATPATKARYRTIHASDAGKVKIETRRRRANFSNTGAIALGEQDPKSATTIVLEDTYGAIVWQRRLGKGEIILVNTPHLAANAYQDEPGNYRFLQSLVVRPNYQLWVDEYIHGYKDADAVQTEGRGNWAAYLAKTPLLPVLIQLSVLLIVSGWAANRRFGQPIRLPVASKDNNLAYIHALATVLHKANSSDFVLKIVGKAEQLHLQQMLGLGTTLVDRETLVAAWVEKTGQPAKTLQQLLAISQHISQQNANHNQANHSQRFGDTTLLQWLEHSQKVRQSLPS